MTPGGLLLTRACWPVFLTVMNVARQVRAGAEPDPEQVRMRVAAVLRDGGELAGADAAVDRAWRERIRAMLIYFVDYRMVQMRWRGQRFWLERRFETSPDGLGQTPALGGNKFFEDCDALQKVFLEAERQPDRQDKGLLAEQLALYFTCLRLGFRGQFQERPDRLEDYERQLYALLPGQRLLGDEELFPDAYKHTVKKQALYPVGRSLAIVAGFFTLVLVGTAVAYQIAWRLTTGAIAAEARLYADNPPVGAPTGGG